MRQKIFGEIFRHALSKESAAADEWALTNGSEYMGAGVLTGITGNRADGVVWDDLIKGRDQADSQLMRQKTWDAYFDDLLTRKKPNAWEIGITTRWHEDDIAGRILPEGYAGESGWHRLPRRQSLVRGLHSGRGRARRRRSGPARPASGSGRNGSTPDHFTPFKRNPRTWAALYQQRPAPEEGDYFKARLAARCREGAAARASSHLRRLRLRGDRRRRRLHGACRGRPRRRGAHVPARSLAQACRRRTNGSRRSAISCSHWKPIGWAEEQGQIKSGVGPFLDKRMRERRAFVAREQFAARGDKAVRAQSMRGRMALEGLYVPAGSPWLADFRAELLSFPAGRHDDQVDAIGLVGQLLDTMVRPAKPKQAVRPARDRWDSERESANWKTV